MSQYGPDSAQAQDVYERYYGVDGFAVFAKALNEIKQAVGGCGIDYQLPAQSTQTTPAEVAKGAPVASKVTA